MCAATIPFSTLTPQIDLAVGMNICWWISPFRTVIDNIQDMLNGVSSHTANLLQLDFLTYQYNAARSVFPWLFFSKFLVLFF